MAPQQVRNRSTASQSPQRVHNEPSPSASSDLFADFQRTGLQRTGFQRTGFQRTGFQRIFGRSRLSNGRSRLSNGHSHLMGVLGYLMGVPSYWAFPFNGRSEGDYSKEWRTRYFWSGVHDKFGVAHTINLEWRTRHFGSGAHDNFGVARTIFLEWRTR